MSSNRSPRYPVVGLGDAINYVGKIFDKEGRAPVTKSVVASHMGYGGINGSSLKAISALRKYGLVDEVGDQLKVSQDAIVILANRTNPASPERIAAIQRAAFRVELFAELHKKVGPNPSEQNLASQLVVAGFSQDGAVKAARAYLATMALVALQPGGYKASDGQAEPPGEAANAGDAPESPPPTPGGGGANRTAGVVKMMENERELTTGLLSKGSSFRLIVSGPVGVKEIERLIAKLELDKEILAEPDDAGGSESGNG